MTHGEGTTRRGFMAALGIGAAALAVPAGAAARAAGTGPDALLPGLREWYARELERFAEDREDDLRSGRKGDALDTPGGHPGDFEPTKRLGAAIRERFGLQTTETPGKNGCVWISGDEATALLIAAVSPCADEMGMDGWPHAADYATACIEEDVLRLAESRGWIERP